MDDKTIAQIQQFMASVFHVKPSRIEVGDGYAKVIPLEETPVPEEETAALPGTSRRGRR